MGPDHLDTLSVAVQRYHAMSSHAVRSIADLGTMMTVDREAHLTEQGRSEHAEYFLLVGTLHRYVIDAEGERVTTAFHTGPSVITPYFARTVNGRSMFNLQALVPATLLAVPVVEFDRMRYSNEEFRSFGLKVVEQELIGSIRQGIAFRELSARDRLLGFRKEHPGLENQVPHTTIASYLGITPVSFSRLRKELARH